ncbi:MAG: SAM hydrolase/SAM-dependent halogenase family protein, partial [Vicinamibacterales bacterium]
LELAAACPYFPEGTIFVAVVDPGVGSGRRGIAAEGGGFRFVAPDNGLLTLAVRDLAPATVVELTAAQYARPRVSRTFEARDRFAPAAGWLATGVPLSVLGPRVHDPIELAIPAAVVSAEGLRGEVLKVDRFGNLVTSIDRGAFGRFAGGGPVRIAVGAGEVAPLVDTYADARARELCALIGSSGRLEIAVSGGSAADRLGLARGAPVVVSRG